MQDKKLELAKKNSNKILFIHYSCQSFTDENEGYSPRITSIAVLFNEGHILKSFSIHFVAEIMHIKRDDIEQHYDEIEKIMLESFFEFAQSHYDYYWLHWNMSNINYGFEGIEHRYQVLTNKTPYHVDEEKRINLSKLITRKYGNNCVDDPKMINLMELNGGKHRDYLSGAEEVEAFKNKEYLRLHKSTMCKVYWFSMIFYKLIDSEIKTKKKNWKLIFKSIFEHPIIQIFSLIALLFSIATGIYWLFTLFFPQNS